MYIITIWTGDIPNPIKVRYVRIASIGDIFTTRVRKSPSKSNLTLILTFVSESNVNPFILLFFAFLRCSSPLSYSTRQLNALTASLVRRRNANSNVKHMLPKQNVKNVRIIRTGGVDDIPNSSVVNKIQPGKTK